MQCFIGEGKHMAFCTNCGHQLVDGAKFCFECGAKVHAPAMAHAEQRKSVYDGEIHKCPNCGEILNAYESVCGTCGYERRGAKATNSVQELSKKLQEIELLRPSKTISSIFKQALTQGQLSKTDEQKIDLIKNFPIPNAREDILEFAVLAISNVDPDVFSKFNNPNPYNTAAEQSISNAWLSKFEQAFQKGRLMFGDSPELENLHSLYVKKKRTINRKKNIVWIMLAILYGVIGLILGIIALAGGFS